MSGPCICFWIYIPQLIQHLHMASWSQFKGSGCPGDVGCSIFAVRLSPGRVDTPGPRGSLQARPVINDWGGAYPCVDGVVVGLGVTSDRDCRVDVAAYALSEVDTQRKSS